MRCEEENNDSSTSRGNKLLILLQPQTNSNTTTTTDKQTHAPLRESRTRSCATNTATRCKQVAQQSERTAAHAKLARPNARTRTERGLKQKKGNKTERGGIADRLDMEHSTTSNNADCHLEVSIAGCSVPFRRRHRHRLCQAQVDLTNKAIRLQKMDTTQLGECENKA